MGVTVHTCYTPRNIAICNFFRLGHQVEQIIVHASYMTVQGHCVGALYRSTAMHSVYDIKDGTFTTMPLHVHDPASARTFFCCHASTGSSSITYSMI